MPPALVPRMVCPWVWQLTPCLVGTFSLYHLCNGLLLLIIAYGGKKVKGAWGGVPPDEVGEHGVPSGGAALIFSVPGPLWLEAEQKTCSEYQAFVKCSLVSA